MTASPIDQEAGQRKGVILIFEGLPNKRVSILLDKESRLWSLTKIFATLSNRCRGQIRFSKNGNKLKVDLTPAELGLKDNDIIIVTASPDKSDKTQFMISKILENLRKNNKETIFLYNEKSEIITVLDIEGHLTLTDLFTKYHAVSLNLVRKVLRIDGSDVLEIENKGKTLNELGIKDGSTIGIEEDIKLPLEESDAMDVDDPILQSSGNQVQDEIVELSSLSQDDSRQQTIALESKNVSISVKSSADSSASTQKSSSLDTEARDGQPTNSELVPTIADNLRDNEQSDNNNSSTITKNSNSKAPYIALNTVFETDLDTFDDTAELPPGNQQTGNYQTQNILGNLTLEEQEKQKASYSNGPNLKESQTSVISIDEPLCYSFILKGSKDLNFSIYADETFEKIFKQYRDKYSSGERLAFRFLNNIVSKKDTPVKIGAFADKTNTIEAIHVEVDAIYLQLRGEGTEMYVRTKPHTKLKRAFNYFAKKHNLRPESLKATYRGNAISRTDTPTDLELENGAILEFRVIEKKGQ